MPDNDKDRYRLAICKLAAICERNGIAFTPELKQHLTRYELEKVQEFINEYVNYPKADNWTDARKQ